MNAKIILVITLLLYVFLAQAQTTYKTTEGHVVIVGMVDSQQLVAESHKLTILLDYGTKEVSGRLDLKTINTGNDNLNDLIENMERPVWVTFSGTIPIDDFILQPHEPVSFTWPINLGTSNRSYDIILAATLKHFDGGNGIACMLTAFGEISSKKAGLQAVIPGISDLVKIQFTKVILSNK